MEPVCGLVVKSSLSDSLDGKVLGIERDDKWEPNDRPPGWAVQDELLGIRFHLP